MINEIPLGEMCPVKGGYAFKSTDYSSEGIPLIRIGSISNESVLLNGNTVYLPLNYKQEYKNFLVEEGDILIALSGATTGKFGIYPFKEPALLNQRVAIIKLSQTSRLNSKYIYYYLPRIRDKILYSAKGAAQPNISTADIEKFPIPDLSIDKQNNIVSILDKANSIRQKRRETLRLADEFLRSTFLEMFGDPVLNDRSWKKKPLSELVELDRNSIDPSNLNDSKKYIGLEDIESETGKIINYTIVNSGYLRSNKFSFTNNHLLYGKLRPYLNKVALPSFDGICSTDIVPILPKPKKSTREFIAFLMRHKAFVSFADSRSSGANLPRISPSIIEKFDTLSPDYNLQREFSEIVEKTEQLKRNYEQSLQESENLFNSLMNRAFRGEL